MSTTEDPGPETTRPSPREAGDSPGVVRYRKKPVTVETMLWTGDNYEAVCEFTTGNARLLGQPYLGKPPVLELWNSQEHAWIPCPAGHSAVKGRLGEFYPISPAAIAETYEPAGSPDPAGDADDLPWPPWLENLSGLERIRAIVAAVDACAAGHGPPVRPHGASYQHCTTSMAEHFLAKMLVPGPPGDQVSVSRDDLQWAMGLKTLTAATADRMRDAQARILAAAAGVTR